MTMVGFSFVFCAGTTQLLSLRCPITARCREEPMSKSQSMSRGLFGPTIDHSRWRCAMHRYGLWVRIASSTTGSRPRWCQVQM